jgi:hypothetical protein
MSKKSEHSLYIILLDISDLEYIKEEKKLIIHHGGTQIKFYQFLNDLKKAIDEKRWLIYRAFSQKENNCFSTGEICSIIKIDNSQKYGDLYYILTQSGKFGWIHPDCLEKIKNNIDHIEVCECLD